MQAQKVRPPAQQVEQQLSVKLSTQVMQSALGVAIANVCYSRNLFTPDDYESKPMGPGLPMQRKLKPSDRTAELLSWLSDGVGPSLEKRYLQEVLFIISADEAGDQGVAARAHANNEEKQKTGDSGRAAVSRAFGACA